MHEKQRELGEGQQRSPGSHTQVGGDAALVSQQAAVPELDGWYQLALSLGLCLIPTNTKNNNSFIMTL